MNELKPLSLSQAIKAFKWPGPGSPVKSAELLLTEKCNACCKFCCAWKSLGKDMTFEKAREEIDKAEKNGAWLISLSGGEPLLNRDFYKIVSYCRKKGIKMIQVLSNGLFFSDFSISSRAVKCGVNEVKLSLHSLNAEKHDYLTGVKGSFKKVFRAAENLNRLKVKVSFNFAVNRLNYMEIPIFVKKISAMGYRGFCFMFDFYEGRFKQDKNLCVSYSNVIPYLEIALDYMKIRNIRPETAMLNNFTPCLMPGYENIMADWGQRKFYSKIRKNSLNMEKSFYNTRKSLLKSCCKCIYGDICYGPDRGYVDVFGCSEFKPITKKTKISFLRPLYL